MGRESHTIARTIREALLIGVNYAPLNIGEY